MSNEHITDEQIERLLLELLNEPDRTLEQRPDRYRRVRAAYDALALRPAAQPARNDQFDYMLSTLRYVLGAGQAAAGESARDHYKAIIKAVADRASASDYDEVRYACEAVKRAAFSTPAAQPVGEPVAWRWMPSQVFPVWVYSDDKNRVMEALRFMGHGGVQPLYTTHQPEPDGEWREDFDLAAQMLTWGREEGLTDAQIKEIDAHAKKMFARLAVTPQPVAVPDRVPMTPGPKKNRVEIALETTLDRYNERHGITTPKADK